MPLLKAMTRMMNPQALSALLLCAWIFSVPLPGRAESLTVAVLKSEGNFPVDDILTGFKSGMQQNNFPVRLIIVESGEAADKMSKQIADMKPDILLCIGAKALERAASIHKAPKVYTMIAAENTRPWLAKSDIFGVALDVTPAQQFRIIRQALPGSRRIGVLYDPEYNRKMIEEAKKLAAAAGFSLIAHPVRNIRDIPLALQKLENQIDAFWTIYDQTVYTPETTRYILLQALRKKIPVVGLSPQFTKAGALLAIYGDYTDMGHQAALQAMALSGKTERVPQMSRPRKVRIAVNEKVRALLGIHFSDEFIKAVDQTY